MRSDVPPVMLPEALTAEELAVVRQALVVRPSWVELATTLESEARVRDSEGLRTLGLAFVYDLMEAAQEGRRTTAGSPYASMWEDESGSYPPRPPDVVPEVRALWLTTREAIDDPILCARLSDLLFVAEGMKAQREAHVAAVDLRRLAHERAWTALDRSLCMSRAVELLAQLNAREALAQAVADAVALVDELLGQEHPGPPFIVVRTIVALKPSQRPDGMDGLLDCVITRFATDPHNHDGALGLAERATTDAERRTALRQRRVHARTEAARAAEGLTRVALLQRALERARRYGLTAEAGELLREQQELPKEDLGFETTEVSTELPTEAVRAQVDLIVGSHAADLADALARLGAFGPPGGSNADVDDDVAEQERAFPIQGLFGHQLFSPGSSAPTYIANDPESKRLAARGRQRQLSADFYGGVLIAPMLDRAVEHHSRPTHDELTTHFATALIGEGRAARIARALELFWDGDYDAASHVLVPRLESILRDFARQSGLTIVKPASEGRFGGVVTLNHVMTKLRELYADAEWLDYLQALLCDPLAINLRNDIAHGLVGEVREVHAALLVHAACHLALLGRS